MADAEQKPDTELVSIKVKSQDGQEVRGVAFIWALANLGGSAPGQVFAALLRLTHPCSACGPRQRVTWDDRVPLDARGATLTPARAAEAALASSVAPAPVRVGNCLARARTRVLLPRTRALREVMITRRGGIDAGVSVRDAAASFRATACAASSPFLQLPFPTLTVAPCGVAPMAWAIRVPRRRTRPMPRAQVFFKLKKVRCGRRQGRWARRRR